VDNLYRDFETPEAASNVYVLVEWTFSKSNTCSSHTM